jgi:uncharacterized membrane protein
MAGIGFVLRKLYRQDNLFGFVSAGLNSAFASTGPWLFTVLSLGVIAKIGRELVGNDVLFDFRVILIYNFSLSLVLSGAVFMIATRYLSDCIYRRDVTTVPGMFFGALILVWATDLFVAAPFYLYCVNLEPTMAISAIANFLLLSAVWLVGIFISALKNYRLITRAFLLGMSVAAVASIKLASPYGAVGMLNGFSMGILVVIALLSGNVFVEYPHPIKKLFGFMPAFRKYWDIALGGLIYNLAIWADKWVMWLAPEAIKTNSGLIIYPHYDATMFLAYLTTVPAMAIFLFNVETHFFERYIRFYRDIERKASYARIEKNHQSIMRSISSSAGNLFFFQLSIAFICIFLAPEIVVFLKGGYLQIGMLRFGLLGAMFQVLTLFLLIVLSYFDARKASLTIQIVFLGTNTLFTWASLYAGFRYYGIGYFLSTFTTFIIAAIVMKQHAERLPYHTFITTNTSVREA